MTIRKDYMLLVFVALSTVASISIAQVPWDSVAKVEPIGQEQVTFLEADSAEVAKAPEGVMILVEGLKQSRQYGVRLTAPGKEWLEAHPVNKPFPPLTIVEYDKENHPGKFMLRGNPGERFWVSVRGDGPPTWSEIVIAPKVAPDPGDPPTPDPDTPPPGGIEGITKLSSELSAKLADATTAAALKSAIETTCDQLKAECDRGTCPTLDGAKRRVVAAIQLAMLSRIKPETDWYNGWRLPMSEAITKLNAQDPLAYVAIMRAAAKGL